MEGLDEQKMDRDRRMTRVLLPEEILFQTGDDDGPSDDHSPTHSPTGSVCRVLEGLTEEQIQQLLQKMNIGDESTLSLNQMMDEGDINEEIVKNPEMISPAKTNKQKAQAKKVVNKHTKNSKVEQMDKNTDQVELPAPVVKDIAPEVTKGKIKTRMQGKKDTGAENGSVHTTRHTNIISEDNKKDEEMVVKSKKKVAKSKQISAKEINDEEQTVGSEKQKSNNGNEQEVQSGSKSKKTTKKSKQTVESEKQESNDGNEQEVTNGSKSKSTKSTKKTKQTEKAHDGEQKETVKTKTLKGVANVDKGKEGKPLKKSKDEAPIIDQGKHTSNKDTIVENKPEKPVRGKQKNALTEKTENYEVKEKESGTKIGEEPAKGITKKNTKKGTQEIVEDNAIEPKMVKKVQKSKNIQNSHVNFKHNETDDQGKSASKGKPASKTNPPEDENTTKNKKDTIKKEVPPASRRATRKTPLV